MAGLEVLVATMHQKDSSLYRRMNIQTGAVIANQSNGHAYLEETVNVNTVKLITTPYRGVGRNRNLGLLHSSADYILFADDDMVYKDGYSCGIMDAFKELGDADVIIFGVNHYSKGEFVNTLPKGIARINTFNGFKYGTYHIALKKRSIEKHNIWFSMLFGGGAKYGSGEDSLFIKQCLKNGLKIYTHPYIIADNMNNESTWFTGYNEKFYYDKGAWCAAAFPCLKYMAALKLLLRFKSKSNLSMLKAAFLLMSGIKGFKRLHSYEDFCMDSAKPVS
jgi:glycosyltransferase involved in cell wall biosynthesis